MVAENNLQKKRLEQIVGPIFFSILYIYTEVTRNPFFHDQNMSFSHGRKSAQI
jgi:hypothetical protein